MAASVYTWQGVRIGDFIGYRQEDVGEVMLIRESLSGRQVIVERRATQPVPYLKNTTVLYFTANDCSGTPYSLDLSDTLHRAQAGDGGKYYVPSGPPVVVTSNSQLNGTGGCIYNPYGGMAFVPLAEVATPPSYDGFLYVRLN